MKTSKDGLELIKRFEGLRLRAYKCPAGKWTIGYGHTGYVNGKPVGAGMTISENMADTLLSIDLQKFEKVINDSVLPVCPLNQHQFDALVSFVYNVGSGNFQKSTMLKRLKEKNIAQAAIWFDRWVFAGGKKLPGLVKRRAAEKALFLKK